jgi:hypothetical protein
LSLHFLSIDCPPYEQKFESGIEDVIHSVKKILMILDTTYWAMRIRKWMMTSKENFEGDMLKSEKIVDEHREEQFKT